MERRYPVIPTSLTSLKFDARKPKGNDCKKCHNNRGIWSARTITNFFLCDGCLADMYAYVRNSDVRTKSKHLVSAHARSYQASADLKGWLPGTVVRRLDRRRA